MTTRVQESRATHASSAALPLVRRATTEDLDATSQLLARAFLRDPLMRWLIPSDATWNRRGHRYFRLLLARGLEHGEVFVTEDRSGAAIVRPPVFSEPRGIDRMVQGLRILGLLRARAPRSRRLAARLRHAHPAEPHWFVSTVGVDADHRGRGIASSLLRPVLERCDAAGVPCAMESSNPDNTPLFRHLGFEVTERIDLDPGPEVRCMTKAPRNAQNRGAGL